MRRVVVRGLTRRDPDEIYEHLSFDEKAVGVGHDYITVLSDAKQSIVIDVEVGRTKESVAKLCTRSLSKNQRGCVKTVGADMWEAYIYGAKTYFPEALHSYDNFHLVGYLNKAVDKVRRREVKTQDVLKQTRIHFSEGRNEINREAKVEIWKYQRIEFRSLESMANKRELSRHRV